MVINDYFLKNDKKYIQVLRKLGFYRSQVDRDGLLAGLGPPDISVSCYVEAFNQYNAALFDDLESDLDKDPAYFRDFLFRYAKPQEAEENYMSMILESFLRETTQRQIDILREDEIDEKNRAALFARLPIERQQDLLREGVFLDLPDAFRHGIVGRSPFSEDILENKRLRLIFLHAAVDALARSKTTGLDTVVSILSLSTLGLIIAGILTGVLTGFVFMGLGLGAAPVTIGVFFLHYAATKIMRLMVSEYQIRERTRSLNKSHTHFMLAEYRKIEAYIHSNHAEMSVDDRETFGKVKKTLSDSEDHSVALLTLHSLGDLQRKIDACEQTLLSVTLRNQRAREQNIQSGMDVIFMALALVMLFFLPPPVSLAIVSLVAAYAMGKLLVSILRDGLTIPYVGNFKMPAVVVQVLLPVGQFMQMPIRFLVIKPYQALVSRIFSYLRKDYTVLDEVITQQWGISGSDSAGFFKDSVQALQFRPTGSLGHTLFGGTVILSDACDSFAQIADYMDARSKKQALVETGCEVISSGFLGMKYDAVKSDMSTETLSENIQSEIERTVCEQRLLAPEFQQKRLEALEKLALQEERHRLFEVLNTLGEEVSVQEKTQEDVCTQGVSNSDNMSDRRHNLPVQEDDYSINQVKAKVFALVCHQKDSNIPENLCHILQCYEAHRDFLQSIPSDNHRDMNKIFLEHLSSSQEKMHNISYNKILPSGKDNSIEPHLEKDGIENNDQINRVKTQVKKMRTSTNRHPPALNIGVRRGQ